MNFAAGAAVVNSGVITGTGGTAINVASAAGAVTVDQNAGTITGAIKLISTDDTLNVSGGAINGNIVGRGIGGGGTVNFTLGAGSFVYANTIAGMQAVNVNSGTLFDCWLDHRRRRRSQFRRHIGAGHAGRLRHPQHHWHS